MPSRSYIDMVNVCGLYNVPEIFMPCGLFNLKRIAKYKYLSGDFFLDVDLYVSFCNYSKMWGIGPCEAALTAKPSRVISIFMLSFQQALILLCYISWLCAIASRFCSWFVKFNFIPQSRFQFLPRSCESIISNEVKERLLGLKMFLRGRTFC